MTGVSSVQTSASVSARSPSSEYVVKPGDTLSEIAARHGVDWHDLARANNLKNPDLIFPGQRISFAGVGGAGSSGSVGGVGGTPAGNGSNAYEVARQYLGQNASSLKVNRNDDLPMDANVPNNVCCANFVSGVLTEAGQLPAGQHTNSVAQLNSTLRGNGWTQVSPSEARPGDVVIIQGGGVSHTEIYAGNGRMIGSNNVNSDGSQRISENNLSWALDNGAVILRAPAGVTGGGNGGTRTEGTGGVNGPAPTGQGTRDQRIDQAITFFQNQGWTRDQAIGIVANLDMESRMDPGIRQIGGGPGYGLAQWEGPRQADFQAWAGRPIQGSSFEQQLRFVQHELSTTERGAANALRGATNPADAAEIVTRRYERPADVNGDSAERRVRANEIANR